MSFVPLKRILPQIVRSHGISRQIEARRVLESAATVLRALWGEKKAAYITPVSFAEGVLKLASSSASALQQLRVDETRILNEVNRQLGARSVMRLDARAKGF